MSPPRHRRRASSRLAAGVAAVAAGLALGTAPALAEPPVTSITSGPEGTSVVPEPEFHFIANRAATFECSVDGGAFAPCTSPARIGPLALGPHTFTVRATGTDGETEIAPPSRSWTLEPPLTNPVVRLRQPRPRALALAGLRILTGSARSPSGIARVQVALLRGGPDREFFPPRCEFIHLETGAAVARPCPLPRYFSARGTLEWRYRVPERVRTRLAPGRYTLLVRAFNGYQQATQARFPLRLRR